jgi:hypothetical protein
MVNQFRGRLPSPAGRLSGISPAALRCAMVFLQNWVCVILIKL